MKWQDVKKLLIGGSVVGIVTLFSALFLLTGVSYTHSGDIECGEVCESYINITTTYWRICFDSYDDTKYENETLFKKQTRSRTLHVNLDKVDNIIHTEPEVEVDWLVPTYGNKWRPIKNGDCWDRGKVNKIKLVGHKEATQTVKWSFNVGDEVNIDPNWYGIDRDIGYEFLENNKVVHIWNTQDDYFFNKNSGIQFTNHFQDYWTRNVFCIGYYDGEEWNKIKCADELENFNRNIETDNETYVNATLWKDISYESYDLRLGIQYHLGLDDKKLSVTIYGKNIGIDIPFDLGFAWKITDWEIPHDSLLGDSIFINQTDYNLDGTFDLTFKNMSHTYYNNKLEENVEYDSYFRGYDWTKFLRVDWNENLNYAVKMFGNGNQEDFYVALLINAGHFSSGQEKSTTFYWIDAEGDYTNEHWDTSSEGTKAWGITTDGTNIWVHDIDNLEVYKYNMAGVYQSSSFDTGAQGVEPQDITTNRTFIWVIDKSKQEVDKYTIAGSWVGSFDISNEGANPRGITTDGSYIWTSTDGAEVYKYNMAGVYQSSSFDTAGAGCSLPRGMTTDGTNIWIVCQNVVGEPAGTIYKFTTAGSFVTSWNTTGVNGAPRSLTVDGGYLWVTDNIDDEVYKYEVEVAVVVYALNITDPMTGDPESVSSGDNITITFNFTEDDVALTSGVTMNNITIGGVQAPVVTSGGVAEITLVGDASGNTDNAASVVVDVSGIGIQDDDLILFFGSADGVGYALPSGFIQLQNVATGGTHKNILAYKIADSEPGSYTVDVATVNERGIAIFTVYRGVDTDDPIDASNSNTGGIDATGVISAITPTNDDSAVVVFIGTEDGNNGNPFVSSWGATLVEQLDNVNGPPGTGAASSAGAYADVIQTSKAQVSGNIALAGAGGTTYWGVMAVSLNVGTSEVEEFGYYGGAWNVNVTVPTFVDGLKDLFVNATYSGNQRVDTETNAINYGVTDTCTYTSGDWNVDCADDCLIESPVIGDGSDFFASGLGTFTMTTDVSGFANYYLLDNCDAYCLGGCFV